MLHRNMRRFRGGLVVKAHNFGYHSTLGLREIKKKKCGMNKRDLLGGVPIVPPSSEHGTYKIVKARFWPHKTDKARTYKTVKPRLWFQVKSLQRSKSFPLRLEADLRDLQSENSQG